MLNVDDLDPEVLEAIAKNLSLDPDDDATYDAIAKLTPEVAFQRWCVWNGFLGSWHSTIADALDNIRNAAKKSEGSNG